MRPAVSFSPPIHARLGLAFGTVLVFLAWSIPAFADNPFDMEPSSWISFDRYKEKPTNWIPPEVRAQAAMEPVVVPAPTLPPNMPIVTAPARPIETPVLPGVNGNFSVNVSSTADDNHSPVNLNDKSPELSIPQTSWKDAYQFAHNKKNADQGTDDSTNGPLDVRFTYLPASMSMMLKTKKPVLESLVKKTEVAEIKPPPPPVTVAAPPSADPAACAAIDAYKKRQLAAIESDRQTLSALQSAIAQLGLQKKLDFMVGASSRLKLKEAGTTTIDMPVAKN